MKISIESALTLLHGASYGTLATVSTQLPGFPYATAVPFALDEKHCPVLCVSALAEHTKNLIADCRTSLSVVKSEGIPIQSATRMTLIGDTERFEPSPELLARYLRYQPDAEQHLALDFLFFRFSPQRARFIAGIGRMGWLEISDWQAIPALALEDEDALLKAAIIGAPPGIHLLGIDCFGIDYETQGFRQRQHFPDAPLRPERIGKILPRIVATLN